MVGDRGMITTARIEALKPQEAPGGGRLGWLTALRAPAIEAVADDGPLQLSLFDQHDLAEITHPDYPGERLVACRNPALAAERARKRGELLAATENAARPDRRPRPGADAGRRRRIGVKVGKVVNKYKIAKHFQVTITDTSLTVTRRQAKIDAEAALDGIYVLRTPLPAADLDAAGVVTAYKNLAHPRTRLPPHQSPTTWTCARSATSWKTASTPTC